MPQLNNPSLWSLPVLKDDGHKYDRGCAVVFGGTQMTGAARLVSAAAMRIGAGLCIVSAPKKTGDIYRAALPAHIIVEDFRSVKVALKDSRRNAAVIGPGLGQGTKRMVLDVVRSGRAAVLDADALTQFENRPEQLLKELSPHTVLTPHEGEFARLFPNVRGDRVERAVAAAGIARCVVVLKGAETIIAAPDKEPVINDVEAPMLATAGSGDVLAGMIGGLLAQGMAPFEAASAAVYLHARAAQVFGKGLVASDLPDMIPFVLKEIA